MAKTIPNVKKKHTVVLLNAGKARAMRAPGHPQNCVLTEGPIDDLAAKLGMDPLQLRLKNLPPNMDDAIKAAPNSFNAIRQTLYSNEIEIAARIAAGDKVWHPPGEGPLQGAWRHGIGMALHTWGGAGNVNNDVFVTISSDGSVLVQSSTQDIGVGEKTVLAIVIAETLGL